MKVIDIALKDLTRSLRSLFAIGMMVAAPLVLTGLIYLAFGGLSGPEPDLPAIKVGLVNHDQPADDAVLDIGGSILEMFNDPSVEGWLSAISYEEEASAREALDRQEIGAAVIIPADLSRAALAGEALPAIRILQDPTLTIAPQMAKDMVLSMLQGVAGGGVAVQTVVNRQELHGVAFDPSTIEGLIEGYSAWYTTFQRNLFHNPDAAVLRMSSLSSADEGTGAFGQMIGLIMAGQMIFFAFFTAGYSMSSIVNEEESGTLARLFTTPTNRNTILAGKFLAVLITVLIQALVLVIVGGLLFKVRWGQPGSASLAVVGQMIAATGLGSLLIAPIKNSRQTGPVLGGALTVLGMLGGVMTAAVPDISTVFEKISLFLPHGWVLRTWKLSMEGYAPGELLLPFMVAVAFGVACFALGAVLFRRRYA